MGDSRRERMRRNPTSFDVARLAGVSQSTVSLVLNGKAEGRVSEETQKAVQDAANEIGYYRNSMARALRLGTASTLALVIPDLINPYFASLLRGAQNAARRNGYVIVMVETENDPNWQKDVLDTLCIRAVDGFILAAVFHPQKKFINLLKERTVILDAYSDEMSTINIDNRGAINTVIDHLKTLGHRRIAFVSSSIKKDTFIDRRKAYMAAVDSKKIGYQPGYFVEASFDFEKTRDLFLEVLSGPNPPTAVICEQDLLAVGVYKAAYKLGKRIPEDLSVVGFDGITFTRYLDPELTTIAVPAELIGERAVETLVNQLKQTSNSLVHEEVPIELIIRKSTGPSLVDDDV